MPRLALWLLPLYVLLGTLPAQAAWLQKQGEWFTANSLLFYETRHFITDNGTKRRQPAFRKYEVNFYGEYGLREDMTIGFNGFLHQLESESIADKTRRNYGLADVELFTRSELWRRGGVVLSIQPLVKFPSFYKTNRNPLSGTDHFDFEFRLMGGYGFTAYGQQHYTRLDVAYRQRLGEWRDQLKVDATAGIRLNENWSLMPQLFITHRINGSAQNTNNAATINDYDLLKGQISVLYDLNKQATLQLGAFSHLRARNTGGGGGFMFSIWHRF